MVGSLSSPRQARAQAAPGGLSNPSLSVANTTFDPLDYAPGPPPGAPAFAGLNGPQAPSPMGKDYILVQRQSPITQAWRDLLEGAGAELLAVQSPECLLVRMPEGSGPTLDGLPGPPRWWGYLLPAYKPSWMVEPLLRGIVPPEFVQPDGSLLLVALLHRGETPALVAPELLARLRASDPSCAASEVAGLISPPQATANGDARSIVIRIATACAASAVGEMARTEAVAFVSCRAPGGVAADDAVWYAQTHLPPSAAPPDGSVWRYDTTAKLFARGVTGRGEVIANLDQGLEVGDCHFRYGPNLADRTEPAPMNVVVLPEALGPGDAAWRPNNKVIAYYRLESGLPPLMDPFDGGGHGTNTAGCAAGDNFTVLAARAGVPLDDPHDDENATPTFAILIDHHQDVDGAAPGAQLVIQDDAIVPASNQFHWSEYHGLCELCNGR